MAYSFYGTSEKDSGPSFYREPGLFGTDFSVTPSYINFSGRETLALQAGVDYNFSFELRMPTNGSLYDASWPAVQITTVDFRAGTLPDEPHYLFDGVGVYGDFEITKFEYLDGVLTFTFVPTIDLSIWSAHCYGDFGTYQFSGSQVFDDGASDPKEWQRLVYFNATVTDQPLGRDVYDAIISQTEDMNENHQETMDKIDDVTDFDDQEQAGMSGQVEDVENQLGEKLGILSFADEVIDQFFGLFQTATESPGIVFPGFSIDVQGQSYQVWNDTVFDLTTIDDGFGALMDAVRFATSFLVYAALFMYVQKIFSAIMQDWSDRNG